MKNSIVDKEYLYQLTWLRGMAAFFVIISHTVRATEISYGADEVSFFLPFEVLDVGEFGVILFFVLSGCTLYISNVDERRIQNVIAFYFKRFMRIWPAFFISFLLLLIFRGFFSDFYGSVKDVWIERQFLAEYTITDVLVYLGLTSNIFGPVGLFNSAYWTLPVEFQYYLLFPFIVLSIRYLGWFGPVVFGFVLFVFPKFGLIDFNQESVFRVGYSFCGGVLLGYIYGHKSWSINPIVSCLLLLLIFIFTSAITASIIPLPDYSIISDKWNWYVGSAILSVALLLFTKFNVCEDNRAIGFLKYYGTVSYGIYLYHNIFIGLAVLLVINNEIHNGFYKVITVFVITFFGSLFFAALSYKFVEKPAMGFSRAVTKKR